MKAEYIMIEIDPSNIVERGGKTFYLVEKESVAKRIGRKYGSVKLAAAEAMLAGAKKLSQ